MWLKLIIPFQIFLLATRLNGLVLNNYGSIRWTCQNDGKCVPVKDDVVALGYDYESQNLCRLVCGQYGSLFPRPTIFTSISKVIVDFNARAITFDLRDNEILPTNYLSKTKQIFLDNIVQECTNSCSYVSLNRMEIKLTTDANNLKYNWETDERYSLNSLKIDNVIKVDIRSRSVYGVRNGLETLSQMITSKSQENDGVLDTLVTVTFFNIEDSPVYAHRGLLVDTAKNFIPMHVLKRIVDGMAATKMNIFHWHATDAQSFPLELKTARQMTKFGAYSSQEIYYNEEIKQFYEYARLRGIRIIMELDMPAHAGNGWQWGPICGLGNLAVCVNQQPWRDYCAEPPCGQINPTNENVYLVLRDIFQELKELVPPEEAFHMGGDSVFFNCWNTTQEIVELLESQGRGRTTEAFIKLWSEFQKKALNIWDEERGKNSCGEDECKIILWSSQLTQSKLIEDYLPSARYIIQTEVESSNPLPEMLLSLGYKLIVSTKNAWYLDHGFWGTTKYYQWRTVYDHRIKRHPNILGGEACMWTGWVDGNDIETRIFPRAAAIGERLWSDPETKSQEAESRFYRHRQRLIDRGVKNDAVSPRWCIFNEGECS